jgi:DNA repair exonuclease SbcCD nuclease subunit
MAVVVEVGDLHLGLVTSEVDRTEEIALVLKQIAKTAIKYKNAGEKVYVIVGGDVFDDNKPSDRLISCFITFLNYFYGKDIDVYVMVGNHDSISDSENLSCLGFIKKLRKGYSYVRLVDDIKTINIDTYDNGKAYFTFLPHITKAHLELEDGKYKSVTEYIEKKVSKVMRVVGKGDSHYIFSHLNVRGLIPGSEENLLRKSTAFLPDSVIMDSDPVDGRIKPTIIQNHIHKHQKHKNLYVVGSPIYTDSSDTDVDKRFCVIHISEGIGKKDKIEFPIIENCRRFYDIDLNLLDSAKDPMTEVKKLMKEIKPNSIVKISPTVSDMSSGFDWEAVRDQIGKATDSYVKPINPKVVINRVVRNKEQKIGIPPQQSLKVWFKNYKHERRKERYRIAKEYLQ